MGKMRALLELVELLAALKKRVAALEKQIARHEKWIGDLNDQQRRWVAEIAEDLKRLDVGT